MQSILNEPESNETWAQIAPLLDAAMERLGRKDHDALVLRFFENRNFKEVGTALGASEDAAKMRVSRALGKLRKFFAKRGVSSTTATLAETISVNSIYAAPVALAKTISAVALAKGATASVSTLTLIKGALKIMAWTKAKTAVAAGVGILIAAGTTTLTVKEIEAHRTPVWQKKYDLAVLNQLPPQTRILSPPASRPAMEIAGMIPGGKRMGLGQTFPSILIAAYGLQFNPGQLIFTAPIPAGRYDFICNLPQGQDQALQQEIKKKFGLIARHEVIQTNILLLKIHSGNGTGLRRSGAGQVSYSEGPGSFSSHRQNLFAFVGFLQRRLGALVIDQTQLNGDLDIDLNWDSTSDGLERAMLEQLGLELVPGRGPVEMLVVEKAK